MFRLPHNKLAAGCPLYVPTQPHPFNPSFQLLPASHQRRVISTKASRSCLCDAQWRDPCIGGCLCLCSCSCLFFAVILSAAKDPRIGFCRCFCSCLCRCLSFCHSIRESASAVHGSTWRSLANLAPSASKP